MHKEESEHLPYKLLSELRNEVEILKKKISLPDAKVQELILEIESVKGSIHELTAVFKKALEETKEQDLAKVLLSIQDSVQKTVSQNETIARSMLAISDKIESALQKPSSMAAPQLPFPGMVKHTLGTPSIGGMRMAPRPGMIPSEKSGEELPPPPPRIGMPPDKRKLIGDVFK